MTKEEKLKEKKGLFSSRFTVTTEHKDFLEDRRHHTGASYAKTVREALDLLIKKEGWKKGGK